MEITLYSTGCPRCKVLESKLNEKKVEYTKCTNLEEMEKRGINFLPCLEINGEMIDFGAAVKWVNSLEV